MLGFLVSDGSSCGGSAGRALRFRRTALTTALLGLSLLAGDIAAAAEDIELAPAKSGAVMLTAPDGSLDRSLHQIPADRFGWDGEAVQPWDVSRYLAHGKVAIANLLVDEGLSPEDPSPNQTRWDQQYYDIRLTLDTVLRTISLGQVTMRSEVLDGPLTQVELNFADNMTISTVTSGGSPTTFSRGGNVLTVTLDRPYATGELIEVVVQYSGRPTGGSFLFDTFGGQPMVWSLSQPFGARTWWPCKDYPDDKAESVDIRITAPTGHRIASNGSLVSETDNGTTSFAHWHESYPIATYLVHLGVHPYTLTTGTYVSDGGDSLDLVFYDFPSEVVDNAPANAVVDEMLGVFADLFGEYPYMGEKYGHNQFLFSGGMEHQTCTSMGAYFESIVAHEAMHQWWGDMVTCRTYNHVWLNEGFATYGEALWAEAAYGQEAYFADILANQYFGPGTIYVVDDTDQNAVFNSNLSYNKGSFVLHMLRHVVGDAAFFQTFAEYRAQFAYSSATTEDFQAIAEAESGLDLDAFFQQWIYGDGYPIYEYDWTATGPGPGAGGSWSLDLSIDQLQTNQVFTMPIDVVVTTTAGTETFVVQNDAASDSYLLLTSAEPIDVKLDPENWILRQVIAPIPQPTFTRGILLVNGVDWETYGAEITASYAAKAFWGDYAIEFWDQFDEPVGGYPSTLPDPRGTGPVPGAILGEYEHVIWVGNNFNGDLAGWLDTPIYSYLAAGGNVLLLSRMGEDFLNPVLESYLGIDFLTTTTANDCIALQPGFTNIARTGTQSFTATWNLAVGPNTTLLYNADAGFNPNRGLGAVVVPPDGGEFNPDGGRFAFLSGRPYRWNSTDLRANVTRIISQYFDKDLTDVGGTDPAVAFGVDVPNPNPFHDATTLRYALPQSGQARLDVIDVSGRLVRTLVSETVDAGTHTATWDGRDERGAVAPSGVYFIRLSSAGKSSEAKLLRVE